MSVVIIFCFITHNALLFNLTAKKWESDGLHHKRRKREKGKWGERYRKGEVNNKSNHYL